MWKKICNYWVATFCFSPLPLHFYHSLGSFFFFVVVFCGSARDGEMYWDAKLYPDLKCMHFLHYFPLKIGETNDVEKVRGGRGWSEGDHFFQSGVHERRRRLILDILKAPEAYRSFLIKLFEDHLHSVSFCHGGLDAV